MNKKIFFCCTCFLTGLSAMAQTVNDKPIKALHSNFALITSAGTNNGNNDIIINFGREDNNIPPATDAVIEDNKGNKIVFHSMNEALQFMEENGYKQIDNFMFTIDKKTITQYLLQKAMENNLKFKIGDGVTVTSGPMKKIYGTIVYFDKKKGKYLIRFTTTQQLYYTENEIEAWKK